MPDWIAGAAWAASPWKCPNDNTNWIASANSARREPCLILDRNHFIRRRTPHRNGKQRPSHLRCYIITSGMPGGCQPQSGLGRKISSGQCNLATPGACSVLIESEPNRLQILILTRFLDANRHPRSLSSGAHSRDPLARKRYSPNHRGDLLKPNRHRDRSFGRDIASWAQRGAGYRRFAGRNDLPGRYVEGALQG
jgi:hypothetical protein